MPIRVVDIDDGSLSQIGQWPWPRTVVAQLVDKLREAGAAVVAFDIDIAEPDRTSPQLLLPLLARNGVRPEEVERVLAVVPEAVWLLWVWRSRRPVQLAVGVVGLCGLGLIPLAISQHGTGRGNWISHLGSSVRQNASGANSVSWRITSGV